MSPLLATFIVFFAAVGFATTWLYGSQQTIFAANWQNATRMSLRIALVVGVIAFFVCGVLSAPGWVLLAITPVFMLGICLADLDKPPGSGDLGSAIMWCFFLLVPYLIKQFVCDFPVRRQIMLRPPNAVAESIDSPLLLSEGVVTSPLRPAGIVMIEGHERSATSCSGGFIDVGASVVVRQVAGSQLYVDVVQAEESTEAGRTSADGTANS